MNLFVPSAPIPGEFYALGPEHAPLIADHFKRLDSLSKASRFFGGGLSDSAVDRYVSSFDWTRQIVVGYAIDGAVRGVAELGWQHWKFPRTGELAVSVEADWRHLEVASCLIGILLELARGRHVARIEAECLAENVPVQKLLKQVGFRFRRDGTVLKGGIDLKAPSGALLPVANDDRPRDRMRLVSP